MGHPSAPHHALDTPGSSLSLVTELSNVTPRISLLGPLHLTPQSRRIPRCTWLKINDAWLGESLTEPMILSYTEYTQMLRLCKINQYPRSHWTMTTTAIQALPSTDEGRISRSATPCKINPNYLDSSFGCLARDSISQLPFCSINFLRDTAGDLAWWHVTGQGYHHSALIS